MTFMKLSIVKKHKKIYTKNYKKKKKELNKIKEA